MTKKSNPFDMYRLPVGLTSGVIIALPHTDVKFTVTLPANANEEFQTRLLSTLNMHVHAGDTEAKMDINPSEFQASRKRLFFSMCVKSASGLPDEFQNIEDFFAEYPLAAKYLYDEATALANRADEEIGVAMGKSASTANGKFSGGTISHSTNS